MAALTSAYKVQTVTDLSQLFSYKFLLCISLRFWLHTHLFSNFIFLSILKIGTKCFSEWVFFYALLKLWNFFSYSIHYIDSPKHFWNALETYLFKSSFINSFSQFCFSLSGLKLFLILIAYTLHYVCLIFIFLFYFFQ